METAMLRIKFTPLLKNVNRGGSKCCLEIVPEVSTIENLDKIEWRIDDDLIEYNIPMTYKILIKKHEVKQKNKTNIKIYHSCVDLLKTYSIANVESGDISRIISDTLIFSKVESNIERCNILLDKSHVKNLKELCKANQTATLQAIVNGTSILAQISSTKISEAATGRNKSVAVDKVTRLDDDSIENYETGLEVVDYNKDIVELNNNEKTSVNCDINLQYFESTAASALEYVTRSVEPEHTYIESSAAPVIHSEAKHKRELSLSPICSINTYDDRTSNLSIYKKSNTSSFVFHNTPNNLLVKDTAATFSNYCFTNTNNICDIYKKTGSSDKSYTNSSNRATPAMRVAYFVKIMEKEVLPLKLLLKEIRNKCLSLGILCFNEKLNLKQNAIMFKNINCENQIAKRKVQKVSYMYDENQEYYKKNYKYNEPRVVKCSKSTKSNRVVYSVVFDG